MANLTTTSFSGAVSASTGVYHSGADISPWYKLFHCADGTDTNPVYAGTWLHIRTPLPATASAPNIGWQPSIIEVVGYHSYSGEWTHDFKAIVNSTGDGNDTWYGSQIRCNVGNDTAAADVPFVYRSTNTYGNYKRVCIAVKKVGCCCNGWLWIRWWHNSGYRADYAWATVGRGSSTAYY